MPGTLRGLRHEQQSVQLREGWRRYSKVVCRCDDFIRKHKMRNGNLSAIPERTGLRKGFVCERQRSVLKNSKAEFENVNNSSPFLHFMRNITWPERFDSRISKTKNCNQ